MNVTDSGTPDKELEGWQRQQGRNIEAEQEELWRRRRNKQNNAQGQHFEREIAAACRIYRDRGIADIDKTPEPFRVSKKGNAGLFTGRFTAPAQPDFQGTLKGGRSIVFEAKQTGKDRILRSVLTDEQMKRLDLHHELGAIAAVCVSINYKIFFVPWVLWRDMKQIFKRQYVTAEDLKGFEIIFDGAARFLDYEAPGGWERFEKSVKERREERG